MHLVQLLLPVVGDDAHDMKHSETYRALRAELTTRYGGLTAYTRAPAEGLWRPDDGGVARDDIVILEVLVERIEHEWWRALRHRLEQELAQDTILIRAIPAELI